MVANRDAVVERAKAERRHYLRVRIDAPGRLFIPANGTEARCQIIELSPGDARVVCEAVPPADSQIILYADGFGRFEGCVARLEEGGFSLKLQCSPLKREKIAEQLTVHLNRGILDDTVVRRHDRAPTRGIARFTRANGDTIHCEVVDLSLSGVALKTDIRPPLGEMVLIGQTAGRVVRHLDGGIALEFVGMHSEKAATERPFNPFTVVG
jgi:hypothetical protein